MLERAVTSGSKSQKVGTYDIKLLEKEDSFWMEAPQPPKGELWVDCRVNLERLASVNTVQCTAFVKISIVFYWTDERVKNFPIGRQLPPKLWGPRLEQPDKAMGDFAVTQYNFVVVDAAAGRLKRDLLYTGARPLARASPTDTC